MSERKDLSILIPALNEAKNVEGLIRAIDAAAGKINLNFEIFVIDGGSVDGTPEVAASASSRVRVLKQEEKGYGRALELGFSVAEGEFVLTLDADLSHDPFFLQDFWQARNTSEMIIGSRYIQGGKAEMPLFRKILSRILNVFFQKGLSLPFKDLSSGFRLYRSSVLKKLELRSEDFDVLQEILIKIFMNGWKIREIPIHYKPRKSGRSHAKLIRFGLAYLRTFGHFWSLRNSVFFADYEDRAFVSRIPLQRYWQRKRYSIIEGFAEGRGLTLDIGCGSSRILSSKARPIGVDIRINKLLYARRFRRPLVNGSIWSLPFADQTFDCLICSGLIESLERPDEPLVELRRVLKPNGILVVSTPDHGKRMWRMIKPLYEKIVQENFTKSNRRFYSYQSLKELLEKFGFRIDQVRYILHSEMILQSTYLGGNTMEAGIADFS
jgi:dolichol-phosphate mannosyltransferase